MSDALLNKELEEKVLQLLERTPPYVKVLIVRRGDEEALERLGEDKIKVLRGKPGSLRDYKGVEEVYKQLSHPEYPERYVVVSEEGVLGGVALKTPLYGRVFLMNHDSVKRYSELEKRLGSSGIDPLELEKILAYSG